jgi:hypothetical protein
MVRAGSTTSCPDIIGRCDGTEQRILKMPARRATYVVSVVLPPGKTTTKSGSTKEWRSSSGLISVRWIVSPSTTVIVLGEKPYTSFPSSTPPLANAGFRNG